jgi:hypothetical protein
MQTYPIIHANISRSARLDCLFYQHPCVCVYVCMYVCMYVYPCVDNSTIHYCDRDACIVRVSCTCKHISLCKTRLSLLPIQHPCVDNSTIHYCDRDACIVRVSCTCTHTSLYKNRLYLHICMFMCVHIHVVCSCTQRRDTSYLYMYTYLALQKSMDSATRMVSS